MEREKMVFLKKSEHVDLPAHSVSPTSYDVVVVGAGPYGLSTAAHLIKAGVRVVVFGKPMHLWWENMANGMLLRSEWWASNLSDPGKNYDLEHYFRETNQQGIDPLPRETLIDYGLWFQKHAVPDVDETFVQSIERKEHIFEVTLADNRVVYSSAVVMALGLYYYAYRPAEYSQFPQELVSHSSQHCSFDHFSDQSIVVIGAGQSALETAALAAESGAHVQIVTRKPIAWLHELDLPLEQRPLLQRILYPKAGIGPGWVNWLLEHFPYLFQRLPLGTKAWLMKGRGIARYGPAGSGWLKPRIIGKVTLHEKQCVQNIKATDTSLELTLSNHTKIRADHLILGTGYDVDIKNLPMLHSSLLSQIRTYHGAPILNQRFESSVPGLYFTGLSAVPSFGPFYRFIVGTEAAARRVTISIIKQMICMEEVNYVHRN